MNHPKLKELIEYFDGLSKNRDIVVAFSGGVDSSLVAASAQLACGADRVTAVLFDTPLIWPSDIETAQRIADENTLKLEVVAFDPLIIDAVRHNRTDRCYHCKRALLSFLQKHYPDAAICDGSNSDDDPRRRPGMRALSELGILSPLRICNINKATVRECARELGLSNADRESMACKAVSLPYDTKLTYELLEGCKTSR